MASQNTFWLCMRSPPALRCACWDGLLDSSSPSRPSPLLLLAAFYRRCPRKAARVLQPVAGRQTDRRTGRPSRAGDARFGANFWFFRHPGLQPVSTQISPARPAVSVLLARGRAAAGARRAGHSRVPGAQPQPSGGSPRRAGAGRGRGGRHKPPGSGAGGSPRDAAAVPAAPHRPPARPGR